MLDFRKLAFQLAEQNGCSHRFNKANRMAGQDWMNGFLLRHPDLSLRKPEATSGARAMGFNKVTYTQFFNLLTGYIDKYKLNANRIYNCDETGITVNPKGQSKVLATKGKRQVGILTSAERGETVTAVICFSASDAYVSPMLIFPRKRNQPHFSTGLPPGSWVECHETGWITSELFLKWFMKFIEFSRATKEDPVLLLFYGHSSHTKNLPVINAARENGVILLCFPPHCSHKLQPCDMSFMKPLSTYYEDGVRKWLRCNPGKVVTLENISSLFGAAFIHAANMKTAMKGFEATGIWLPNNNVFSDEDFLPSVVTDIVPSISSTEKDAVVTEKLNNQHLNLETTEQTTVVFNEPKCSSVLNDQPNTFPIESPKNILPIPQVKQTEKRNSRKRGKTAILTESPYKNNLQMSLKMTKKNKEFNLYTSILTSDIKLYQQRTMKYQLYHSR
ncbi:uncharacterized protein LOC112686259 [Sipha flava]|uniref:Uncharacterized protein LOC112686259 n=1 Tax=Sipha flava TaxID=143950 RepID=A0A8B8FV70_9HEMI|nr:uncharacterized protein LOC112686259 [Sipha flava]